MYACSVLPRLVGASLFAIFLGVAPRPVAAQTEPSSPLPDQHQHEETPVAGNDQGGHVHDMSQMRRDQHGATTRDASGTAWQPDASPMYAFHGQAGGWNLMAHGNAFIQFLHESGPRGDDQFGSISWVMGMTNRIVRGGNLGLRGMFSLEPWTIRGCGYPDLLASGEICHGTAIHDLQHPHDLLMEIAVQYNHPLAASVRWQVYGGPAGEPALGPAAFPHRLSAMANPMAPIGHHWLDSTHITFGVVTAGMYGNRWKAEASVFNGREPDEDRTSPDFGALDSVSGRFWLLPSANLALQVSAGRLTDAEPAANSGQRIDVDRVTASATYHRASGEGIMWANTIAWGRNAEPDHASNALLVETNVTDAERHTWFGRFEIVGKSAHDLNLPGDSTFTVGKLQGGYTRSLETWRGLKLGVGAGLSVGFVPADLRSVYGSRLNVGFAVFTTFRPAAHPM
jgi:hypothetical protein